jgi:hypothetical protein
MCHKPVFHTMETVSKNNKFSNLAIRIGDKDEQGNFSSVYVKASKGFAGCVTGHHAVWFHPSW